MAKKQKKMSYGLKLNIMTIIILVMLLVILCYITPWETIVVEP